MKRRIFLASVAVVVAATQIQQSGYHVRNSAILTSTFDVGRIKGFRQFRYTKPDGMPGDFIAYPEAMCRWCPFDEMTERALLS